MSDDGTRQGERAPGWHVGDRVEVRLPDRTLPRGRGGSVPEVRVGGTVRAVDPPGERPGVAVDLDREVNGVSSCYATHAELRAVTVREPS